MTGQRTAPLPHVTELRKARVRLPLLTVLGLLGPPLIGVRSTAVWTVYIVFAVLYSLWALRLSTRFSGDRRLGYLLCLTDTAILLPLLAWSSSIGVRITLLVGCAGGLGITYLADRLHRETSALTTGGPLSRERRRALAQAETPGGPVGLERAVQLRLRVFTTTGARFGLVVLRVARFEETASYYGAEASDRLLSAVSRRGLRLFGPDAQHFTLPGGRVAFLFETEPQAARLGELGEDSSGWSHPYDVEGLAMAIGRKVCEHLIDGRRVECVVGWASAPADGLSADDLMYAAESGAQSTAAFRRVASPQVPIPERARAAAG
jgi:GGDEF domain-containing protein